MTIDPITATDLLDVSDDIIRFRLASRDLFNNHFFQCYDCENTLNENNWLLEERFASIEAVLFEKIVIETCGLPKIKYGSPNPNIFVVPRYDGKSSPIQVNRGIDTGYWDFPLSDAPRASRLSFIKFFDWNTWNDYREYQYVRVRIEEWPDRPDVRGKHGLIEARNILFQNYAPTEAGPK